MPNKLILRGVTKRFDKTVAVDNLNLEVADKEFMVLVGPSGCGKTTLLRIIAGLENPEKGEIYVDDKLVNSQGRTLVGPGKRGVHMIFQSYALWPHMKVSSEKGFSNISFPLKVRQWVAERIKARTQEVTHGLGIPDEHLERKPGQLSAGEQQRVAVARGLVIMPELFLLDEPLANIDPVSKRKVREEIRQNHREWGLTTIMVTHNMADGTMMANRMAIMDKGKIVQVGTPRELYDTPLNDFVAEFMRSGEAPTFAPSAER